MDYNYLFKIILIGDANVGKTCLVRRFTKGYFPPAQGPTIGVDFTIKSVEVDGENVKLQIWDTAGQERFRSITQSYYHNADGVIVTYDITSKKSFESLPAWLEDVHKYTRKTVFPVIVGNKCDLDNKRQVDFRSAQNLAEGEGSIALETSAKDSDNVELLFMNLATKLKRNLKSAESSQENDRVASTDTKSKGVTLGGHSVCSKGPLGMSCCRV